MLLLVLALHYTVPAWEATGCDSLVTVCDSTGCHEFHFPERMGTVEVWWAPRWGSWQKLYEKDVQGREGMPDTASAPSDTIGSVYLIARDRAGNRSCPGNLVTVNLPPVGVAPPLLVRERVMWFDVSGRHIPPDPSVPGVYFKRFYRYGMPFRTVRIVVS